MDSTVADEGAWCIRIGTGRPLISELESDLNELYSDSGTPPRVTPRRIVPPELLFILEAPLFIKPLLLAFTILDAGKNSSREAIPLGEIPGDGVNPLTGTGGGAQPPCSCSPKLDRKSVAIGEITGSVVYPYELVCTLS